MATGGAFQWSAQLGTAKAPRVHAPPSSIAYNTLGKYGEVGISYNARARPLVTSNRDGSGTWWPDFGPTTRDFSFLRRSHPTDTVFENQVQAFTQQHRREGQERRPDGSESGGSAYAEQPQQFRHPAPQREALYSSTIILPYKKGGRRKCGDDNHWKGVLGGGSGKYPIWCKGQLLDDPDRHQVHPLAKSTGQNIAATCSAANLAAGTPTGTIPRENLERTVSCPSLAAASCTLLSPAVGSTLGQLPGVMGGTDVNKSLRDPVRKTMAVPGGGEKHPTWLAKRTIATRDFDAAGHAGCLLRKVPIELQC